MKSLFTIVLMSLLLASCSKKIADKNIKPNLIVGASLEKFKLNDQFGKSHGIDANTKKVIFAFEQDGAHAVNDYLATKPTNYLTDNKTLFVADVSAAPTLIKKLFIMPGLNDFEHSVLIFEDENIAAPYRVGVDENAIVLVYLTNKKIMAIKKVVPTKEALVQFIEK